MTVKELRQDGYKVMVLHHRKVNQDYVNPKGGKTVVIIDSPNGEHFEGVSVCSSKDLYNKKMGVKIAIGRAFYTSNN